MVGRRDVASWLDGPAAAGYPGQRLGRPETGARSIARPGRRLLGIWVDWMLALLIATGLLRGLHWGSFAALAVLLVEQVVLVASAGATVGQRLAGLRVERLDGGAPGPGRALARAVLLCLAVPALLWDRDQRGLHDRLAGTVLVRR